MPVSDSYRDYVLEQLEGVGRLRARRMFGGVGIYSGDLFFALIADNTLYFKVDDSNREDFSSCGMRPFQPFPDKPGFEMNYYQVPADVIEDADTLEAWAGKALRVAQTAARQPARKKKAGRRKPSSAGRH